MSSQATPALPEAAPPRGPPLFASLKARHGTIALAAALVGCGSDAPSGPSAPQQSRLPSPRVTLKVNDADSTNVLYGDSVTVSWTTRNDPTSCVASGAWAGSKNCQGGSERIGPLTSDLSLFILSVSNAAGSNRDTARVRVSDEPWPAEVQEMREKLTLPEGLRLRRISPESQSNYNTSNRTIFLGAGAPVGGELGALAHEICHAHQHYVVLNERKSLGEGLTNAWTETEEGIDFLEKAGWRREGESWVASDKIGRSYSSPLEDGAQQCAVWYNPNEHPDWGPEGLKRQDLGRYEWAMKWLPL